MQQTGQQVSGVIPQQNPQGNNNNQLLQNQHQLLQNQQLHQQLQNQQLQQQQHQHQQQLNSQNQHQQQLHNNNPSLISQNPVNVNNPPNFNDLNSTAMANENASRLRKLSTWICELRNPDKRENALTELARNRDEDPDLAVLLWQSIFTVQILVQEIMAVYEYMNPPTLTPAMSNRACNALALFQCIASHPKTRNDLVECRIPVFLYPFLRGNSSESSSSSSSQNAKGSDSSSQNSKATTMQQPLDFLRLTSLGVIGALVKAEDERGTKFLLQNDYMPMGLNIIEHGNELTKIVSTFILLRILSTPEGLLHCCHTYERFSHVAFILGKVVAKLGDDIESGNGDPKQQCKLLNKIIRCYVRLCDNDKALKALNECLPERLKSDFFNKILKTTAGDDHITEQLLTRLRHIIQVGHVKPNSDK